MKLHVRIILIAIIVAFHFHGSYIVAQSGSGIRLPLSTKPARDEITGAWKFISMEINLSKPKAERTEYLAPEWFGQWLFVDGYFSQFLEKTGRCGSACEEPEFEFEAFAGGYSFTDNKLILRTSNSANVFGIHRPSRFRVRITGEQMRLEGELTPIVEDMSEGTVIILLKRMTRGGD